MLIGQCIIGKVREFPYANDLTNRLDNRLSRMTFIVMFQTNPHPINDQEQDVQIESILWPHLTDASVE